MTIDHARVKELFLAVLEMPAATRAVYLDTACAGDTALRQQLEVMLQSQENSGELLPRSPAELLADSGSTDADATAALDPKPQGAPTGIDGGPSDGAESLSFLEPSDKPGHLGRLGRYEILQVIGKGGFGVVLKGFDERLHRVVAIKVLSPAYAANGSARKRFIREAQTAAAVKNEHVVGIYDVEKDAQPPYLAMEMIDGISLQDKLDKHGPLSVKEILRIGLQAAEGLAAAHKQGLVHRDIKPANILLENGVERVKITDFGLARAVDDASVTQSGTVAGTPMYMSPEQAEGLQVDHRSDLFSLGTVLYAMCTGHPPFRASGTHAVLKRVIDASPRPIREINVEIPAWLEAIVAKLHAKKPEDRFQTAKEVAELLGQRLSDVQAGRAPLVNGPKAVLPPEPRSARPPVWITALALTGMGALFIYAAVMLFRLDHVSPPGVQWLVAVVGLGLLVSGVFVAIQSLPHPSRDRATRRKIHDIGFYVGLLGFIAGFSLTIISWYGLALLIPSLLAFLYFLSPYEEEDSVATTQSAAPTSSRRKRRWVIGLPILAGALVLVGLSLVQFRQPGGRPGLVPPDRQIGGRWESDWGPVWLEHMPIYGDNKAATVKGFFIPGPKKKGTVTEGTYDYAQGTLRLSFSEPWRLGTSSADLKLSSDGQKLEGTWTNDAGESGIWTMVRSRTNIPPQPDANDEPAGWVQLFNGKDLTGWDASARPNDWKVENGAIVGTGPSLNLPSTQNNFAEFHLRADIKLPPETDAAIRFRNFGEAVHVGRKDGGYFVSYVRPEVKGSAGFNDKETDLPGWTRVEILAEAGQIEIKINGKTVLGPDKLFLPLRPDRAGPIKLQSSVDGTAVQFRNIQIKDLTPPPTEPAWVQLFNGKDLTGWSAGANADAWKVVGSELVGAGKGTVLRTDRKTSTDFHLRAELKLRRGDQAAIGFHNTSEEVRIGIDGDYATVDYIAPNGVGFGHQGINPKEVLQEEVKPIRVEIIAKLDQIEVKLNDRTIIKGRLLLPGGAPDRSGPILLKAPDSGRGVRFRKIEIKEFPATPGDPLPEPKLVKRPERQMELKAIGLAYTSCLEYRKKPPASAADLKDLLKADPKAWTALNDGSVVFFYNVGVLKMIEGASRTVLAYETRTPDSGGYVLMADGFVRLVTADAFKKMHLAGPRPEPGWVPLFNGKDLKGWVSKMKNPKEVNPDRAWEVLDNVLIARGTPEGVLRTEKVYHRYILEMECQPSQPGPGLAGALLFHIPVPDPDFGSTSGIRLQIEPGRDGSFTPLGGTRPFAMRQIDWRTFKPDWNHLRVESTADRFEIMLNGKSVLKFTDFAGGFPPGYVGIMSSGYGMRYRNIRIKDLAPPPTEPGWVQAFNGKDLTGWKTLPGKKADWKVEAGELVGRSSPDSLLFSETGNHQDFHLKAEVKLNAEGNSGVLFRTKFEDAPGDAIAGYEADLDFTPGNPSSPIGTLWKESKRMQRALKSAAVPDQWFSMEVIAKGSRIQVLVNGQNVVDFTDAAESPPKGHLALQAFGENTVVRFRKIEIKEIPPSK